MGWLTLRLQLKELFSHKLEASDTCRERKMSSSSTGSMKTKWLKAFKSLKTPPPIKDAEKKNQMYHAVSTVIAMRKNGTNAGREMPRTEPDVHSFQEYTYKKITPCDVCSQILRGHTKQGLKCRSCKMNVHLDCQEKAAKCQPKSRLLRRQKSTSEIESRVPEPTLEEENIRESDRYPRMTTFNRQLSFRNSHTPTNSPDSTSLERKHASSSATSTTTSSPMDSISMRRRLFAGMKSLTGFGSRYRRSSPGHRSISLPEKRSSQDASGTRPFGEPLYLIHNVENGDDEDLRPITATREKSKHINKRISFRNKK